jgi:hypothetical protein
MKVEFGREVLVPELFEALEKAAKAMGATFSCKDFVVGKETVFVLGSMKEETRYTAKLAEPIIELPFSDLPIMYPSAWGDHGFSPATYHSQFIKIRLHDSLGFGEDALFNKEKAYSGADLDITIKMVRVRRMHMTWGGFLWMLGIPVIGWFMLVVTLLAGLFASHIEERNLRAFPQSVTDKVKPILSQYLDLLGTNLKGSSSPAPA